METAGKHTLFHLIVFFFVTLFIAGFYFVKQPQVRAGGGKGWDGKSYFLMYEGFRDGGDRRVEHPFHKRVGTPYLASLVSDNPRIGFLSVNIVSGIIAACTVFLITLFLSKHAHSAYFCSLPILCYLFSPLRVPNYCPYVVDPASIAILSLSVLAFLYKRYLLVIILVLISAFFRETGLYYSVIFLVFILKFFLCKKEYLASVLLLLFYLLCVWVVIMAQSHFTSTSGGEVSTVLGWLRTRLSGPFELLKIVAALSMTLGPFLYVRSYHDFSANSIFFVFIVLTFVMSVVGGSDITRIFYLGYPLYVALLVPIVEQYGKWELTVLGFAGLLANRFLNAIPNPQHYWPDHDTEGCFTWTPDHADVQISVGIILFWILVYAGLMFLPRLWQNREVGKNS